MTSQLSPQQQSRYAEFRQFAARHIQPEAAGWDARQGVSAEGIEKVRQAGYLGAIVPEAYGGKGWDYVTFGLLNEAFGWASSSLTVLLTVHNMVLVSLMKWGSHRQIDRWLGPLAKGDCITAFALTEPATGSNIRDIETRFTPVPGGYLLNGTKRWITFAAAADLYLVVGKLDGKPTAAFVEKGTPGVALTPITDMLGFRGCYLGQLHFEDVFVPAEDILGKPGFALSHIAPLALHYGRMSTAFSSAGLVRACLETAVQYAADRRIAGRRVADHGMVQALITDIGISYDTSLQLCMQAAREEDQHSPGALDTMVKAKYYASRKAVAAAADTIQVLGAAGCHEAASPAGRFYRDAKIMEIIEGTNQVLQGLLGKHYVNKYAKKAGARASYEA